MKNKYPIEVTKEDTSKIIEIMEKLGGLEEFLVYVLYNVNNSTKIKSKFSLSSYLILEMFEREEILRYLKDSLD